MENFVFQNPTQLIFGKGQIDMLSEKAEQLGQKVLVVYGGGSIKKTGLYEKVISILKEIGVAVTELPGIEPNPRLTTVNIGIDICKREQIDWILAIGGGSVIDAAKAVAIGAKYEGDVWDFYNQKAFPTAALPLGTILTLAATGSEMNPMSVVTNWETQQKHGGYTTYPTFSILDPENTFSVPKDQTIYGSCDILSHVFEQYFTHTTNIPLQTRFAESIMKTVIENVEQAIQNPNDYDSRANLLMSGTFALNGILSTGVVTDWATHSIEHAVSAVYDIPHGGGLAIIFPNWMKYVYKENVDRFVQFAIEVWGVEATGKSNEDVALEGIEAVRQFFNKIGAPSRLADYNITSEKLEFMAEKAVPFGPIGNFKKLNKEDVHQILEMSL